MNMRKVLIVYYSQTGQLKEIIDGVFFDVKNHSGVEIDLLKLEPEPDYPFPWDYDDFFQVFPESFRTIPLKLKNVDYPTGDYDLVVLAYQVWFLGPSIPFNSFLFSDIGAKLMQGKKVLTILGVRNMWAGAQEMVKKRLAEIDAKLVGNIVFVDETRNYFSIITIARWLLKGNKGPYKRLPEAGVSAEAIDKGKRFGPLILKGIFEEKFDDLQANLLSLGAVNIIYPVLRMEKTGARIFKIFSGLVLAKGGYGEKKRMKRLRFFRAYLLFIIFTVSPLLFLIYSLRKIVLWRRAKKEIRYYEGITLK